MQPWSVLESRYLLERPWMRLREDTVLLPSGKELDEFHVIEYPDWSCVYCLSERGDVVLVEQYRHGVGRFSLELPAGELKPGEDPLEGAKRELLEETGYEASDWAYLGRCAPNPSKHTSYAHIFQASGGRLVGDQALDGTEDIAVRLMSQDDVLDLAERGGIVHGIHMTTIFWAALRQMRTR